MTKNYDVIIVGGGPAGTALGFLLQNAGINNCIVDKQLFPRNKLCGGLLTEKTLSLLYEIYRTNEFPYEKITSAINLFIGKHSLSTVVTNSNFCLVNRKEFDNYLLEQYKISGGTVYEGRKIEKIDEKNKVLLLDNNINLTYNVLVGADGANSQVRQLVDSAYRPNAFCIEANYPSEFVNNYIEVYFATIRNGYGWCFPKNKYYTVGIGGSIKQNKNIKELFMTFSKDIGKSVSSDQIKGAMIPFGKYVKKPCKDNILLIGDAAGLVDPITGEGIYFALKSSICAYNAIYKYLYNNLSLQKSYRKALKDIHMIINNANCFKKVFFNEFMQTIFLKKIEGRIHITKYFCENILANYHTLYMQFPFKYAIIRYKRKLKDKIR